jgi:RHS repeat-associated protein
MVWSVAMGTTTLLATDLQRTVVCSGNPLHRRYTPYGGFTPDDGAWLGFSDAHLDHSSGCYLLGNGHRAFSPALMRFGSPDRLSPFARGGLNAYAYCLGDPINHRDPTGQEAADYLFPILSILSNLAGAFTSGLRLRSMWRTRHMHQATGPNAGSRSGIVSFGTVESHTLPPSSVDWTFTGISGVSAVAGITLGISRTVEPGEDWQTWALATLTVISLGTSVKEVWALAQARSWERYPITPVRIEPNRAGSASPRSSAPRPTRAAANAIRQSWCELEPVAGATGRR